MDDERILNSYHNASSPPGPDVPSDPAGFMLAADPVLANLFACSAFADYVSQRP